MGTSVAIICFCRKITFKVELSIQDPGQHEQDNAAAAGRVGDGAGAVERRRPLQRRLRLPAHRDQGRIPTVQVNNDGHKWSQMRISGHKW